MTKRFFFILFLSGAFSLSQIQFHAENGIQLSWESSSGYTCYQSLVFGTTMKKILEQPEICHLEFQFNKWLNENPQEQKFCFTATECDARLLFAGIRVAGLLDWKFLQEENQFCLVKPRPETVAVEDFFKIN